MLSRNSHELSHTLQKLSRNGADKSRKIWPIEFQGHDSISNQFHAAIPQVLRTSVCPPRAAAVRDATLSHEVASTEKFQHTGL